MRRAWSIRARTAIVFALTSMALTTAVLVFVNLASQRSFTSSLEQDGAVTARRLDGSAPATDTSIGALDSTRLSVVTLASTLQWQWSAVGIVAAGVLAGGLGWYVSRRMLAPIDRITATATRISASNLHERIDLGGPDDELRRLSATIDALLCRLQTAFESQRRFVAQASHELRTPLAVERAALQIGLPDDATAAEIAVTRGQLLEHNRRMEHLVESLLVLAEAERGVAVAREPIDLVLLAHEVTSAARRSSPPELAVTCEHRAEPPGGVAGEPTLVRQVLMNLVDNAVEYNEPGGFVAVWIDRRGFVVENSGPVVCASVVAGLVEPFRRHGDGGTRRHSGLGLSIVEAVVRTHGWALQIEPRTTGGLRIRVDVSPM